MSIHTYYRFRFLDVIILNWWIFLGDTTHICEFDMMQMRDHIVARKVMNIIYWLFISWSIVLDCSSPVSFSFSVSLKAS